jgi:hypothetical protein
MTYKTHDEFVEKYSDIPLEMLSEALWNKTNKYALDDKKISLGCVVYSDRINCTGLAEYEFDEEGYVEFSFRSGNNDGTVVVSYGDNIQYKPTQIIRMFVLDVERLKLIGKTPMEIEVSERLFKLKHKEIEEMQGKMQYDLYFSPTNKIVDYYNEYARKMFLTIEYVEVDVNY